MNSSRSDYERGTSRVHTVCRSQPSEGTAMVLNSKEDKFWNKFFSAFLHWEFIRITAAYPEVFQVPPSGFYLSCAFRNSSSDYSARSGTLHNVSRFPLDSDILNPGWNSRCHRLPDSRTQEPSSCCLWDGNHTSASGDEERAKRENNVLSFLPPDLHGLDLTWGIQCWIQEGTDRLTCEIKLLSDNTDGVTEFALNLAQLSGEGGSADCRCGGFAVCECLLPGVNLTDSYILYVEIHDDSTQLVSPPVYIAPSRIVKPDPPETVRMEITERGAVTVIWSKPSSASSELLYQVRHLVNSSEKSTEVYLLSRETSVTISEILPCAVVFVEVRCKILQGSGVWSEWSRPGVFDTRDIVYSPQKVLASAGSNVSVYCIYCNQNRKVPSRDMKWWFDLAKKVPAEQYSAVSDYVGKVTLLNLNTSKPKGKFNYDALHCCIQNNQCHHRYAEIHVLDTNISIACETDGRQTTMTCRWSTKQIPSLQGSSFEFKFYRNKVYCSKTDRVKNASTLADCQKQRDGSFQCVFQSIYILSGYTMWIEIKHPLGTLYTPPQCVLPIDVVKPLAPSGVEAQITEGTGDLRVSWKRPSLPAYELRYQLRYRQETQDTTWKVMDISRNEFADIQVAEPCLTYSVQVRCRRSDHSGFWGDWSNPVHTSLKDIRAPLKGPDFWRIVPNNPIQKGDNITLIWQPVGKELSLCSIRGYKIFHQVAKNVSWTEYLGNVTRYTFHLLDEVHTVTVLAINSLGCSVINSNLTFSQEMSAVRSVHSFRVYFINSSCVAAVWKLLPVAYGLSGFVIEWRNLRDEGRVRWVPVPSNVSRYYIEGSFYAIEKYQFRLYPVSPEGIGSPGVTEEFTKADRDEAPNDKGVYVILPIIILSSLLLLGTLIVSHQRMKKMFWKDVPNPKYCSWAQGVNFQKPDTLENLFIKPHERLPPTSSLLMEPEAAFENLFIDKALRKEVADGGSILSGFLASSEDPDRDSACATSHFGSSCVYQDGADETDYRVSSCQSSVQYATVITNPPPNSRHMDDRKASVSSFDGCFLGNKTIVIGNLREDKQCIILTGLEPKPPNKRSSNSTVSSEGFSEPSDHDGNFTDFVATEQELYYLGLGSQSDPDNYFSEDSLATFPFQENLPYKEIGFVKDKSYDFLDDEYHAMGSAKKDLLSYMPQFQPHRPLLQGTNKTDVYDLCT
ncbi:leptin receptor [Spea bombifrons]|uniref:leptin receptor n=1 Tax=Spea bombifrons TaxID=233779 RepID=UPI00234B2C75|nr:leptin receptor [Spea bombifrons]